MKLEIDGVESIVRGDIENITEDEDEGGDEESYGLFTRTITVKYDGDKVLIIVLAGDDAEALKIKRAE